MARSVRPACERAELLPEHHLRMIRNVSVDDDTRADDSMLSYLDSWHRGHLYPYRGVSTANQP